MDFEIKNNEKLINSERMKLKQINYPIKKKQQIKNK